MIAHQHQGGEVSDRERERVLRAVLEAGADLGEDLGMSSDDSDEATQALAVKMNDDMARFVRFNDADLRAYVRTSLHHWSNDAADAERRHAEGNLEATKAQEVLFRSLNRADREAQVAYIRDRIHAALEQLPERQRTIVLLTEDEDMSREEIAAQLGMKEEAVKKALFRARQQLRAMLEDVLGDRIEPEKYENPTSPSRHTNDADGEEVNDE